jgi:hypothetical protein
VSHLFVVGFFFFLGMESAAGHLCCCAGAWRDAKARERQALRVLSKAPHSAPRTCQVHAVLGIWLWNLAAMVMFAALWLAVRTA